MESKCNCPNCGSNNKQFMEEILPYNPSIFLIILLGITGIGLFLYIPYYIIKSITNKKHKIKYLCLDCNTMYWTNVNE